MAPSSAEKIARADRAVAGIVFGDGPGRVVGALYRAVGVDLQQRSDDVELVDEEGVAGGVAEGVVEVAVGSRERAEVVTRPGHLGQRRRDAFSRGLVGAVRGQAGDVDLQPRAEVEEFSGVGVAEEQSPAQRLRQQ